MMSPDEIIEIMKAVKAGKTIEGRRCGTEEWKSDGTIPGWDFYHYDYRAKPEPRVIYVNLYQGGVGGACYESRESARKFANSNVVEIAKRYIEDTTSDS